MSWDLFRAERSPLFDNRYAVNITIYLEPAITGDDLVDQPQRAAGVRHNFICRAATRVNQNQAAALNKLRPLSKIAKRAFEAMIGIHIEQVYRLRPVLDGFVTITAKQVNCSIPAFGDLFSANAALRRK